MNMAHQSGWLQDLQAGVRRRLVLWHGRPRGGARGGEEAEARPQAAIVADDIVMEFNTEIGRRRVLDGISFEVSMGERLAILGRNGAGKSTLISLLCGLQFPSSGIIHRGLSMSWPIAIDGVVQGEMTGYDYVRFILRIYGVPFEEKLDYIQAFAELGRQLHLPMRFYSTGMRARLAFALSFAIDFDCILIDEVLAVGDQRFHQRCYDELFVRRKHCAMIVAIHDAGFVREHCTAALVLKGGRGRVFHDVDLATEIYASL
ncbi:ABC transporter ATP-binding protein [Bosea robiniae]|nr:ABC transporter ATP-binding protein [Bosea robiniae]